MLYKIIIIIIIIVIISLFPVGGTFRRETHEMTGSIKGAVSRNSARLGNNKMPIKLRET